MITRDCLSKLTTQRSRGLDDALASYFATDPLRFAILVSHGKAREMDGSTHLISIVE